MGLEHPKVLTRSLIERVVKRLKKQQVISPLDYETIYLMNDPDFMDNIKKYSADRYELLIKYMRKFYGASKLDCCLQCMAYYWKDKYNDPKPACTLGGEFKEEGQENIKICDNCPLKEE